MELKVLTLNFGRLLKKKERIKKASFFIKCLKEKIKRLEKVENVKISKELNEEIWKKGAKKPPRKIRVKIIKEKDYVKVELLK